MRMCVQMGDFIASTVNAKTADELFSVLRHHLAALGYDRLIFNLLSDHVTTGHRAGYGLAANLPSELMELYFENWLLLAEPLRRHLADADRAFAWENLTSRYRLTKLQRKCVQAGASMGLSKGIAMPLRGPRGALAFLGAMSSNDIGADQLVLSAAQLYAQQFYSGFLALERRPQMSTVVALSDQEREVLKWCAVGKTKHEMAAIIGISENAIKCYLRRAQAKLGAANSTAAAFLAIQTGMINL